VKRLGVILVVALFAAPASAAKLPVLASHDSWPVSPPNGALVPIRTWTARTGSRRPGRDTVWADRADRRRAV